MYKKGSHIHFIGIGGIGMSGIAHILLKQGYAVSGCDTNVHQKSVYDLQTLGAQISNEHNGHLCQDSSITLVVYSTAIKQDSKELVGARARGVTTVHRSHMLAEIMRTRFGIAVSGSHGKTTTSSLISHVLLEAEYDPTVVVGGHLQNTGSNAHYGTGQFCVVEADESDRSLLNLPTTVGVITNISFEHLETYKNLHDVTHTFETFLSQVPFYGKAVVCIECPNIRSLLPLKNTSTLTYGLSHKADWSAHNIVHTAQYSTYDAYYKGTKMGTIQMPMPGIHNVLNSLAALTVGHEIEIPFATLAQAIQSFKGVDRRFTFKGICNGASVFDDYGHHPTEIRHTIDSARRTTQGKVVMLFQPHRYSRTQGLWNEFIELFAHSKVDHVIITDIYAASENSIDGITSQKLAETIQYINPAISIAYVPLTQDFSTLKAAVLSSLKPGDVLILQGAGNVNALSSYLIAQ